VDDDTDCHTHTNPYDRANRYAHRDVNVYSNGDADGDRYANQHAHTYCYA
jgi:hypothetical protein